MRISFARLAGGAQPAPPPAPGAEQGADREARDEGRARGRAATRSGVRRAGPDCGGADLRPTPPTLRRDRRVDSSGPGLGVPCARPDTLDRGAVYPFGAAACTAGSLARALDGIQAAPGRRTRGRARIQPSYARNGTSTQLWMFSRLTWNRRPLFGSGDALVEPVQATRAGMPISRNSTAIGSRTADRTLALPEEVGERPGWPGRRTFICSSTSARAAAPGSRSPCRSLGVPTRPLAQAVPSPGPAPGIVEDSRPPLGSRSSPAWPLDATGGGRVRVRTRSPGTSRPRRARKRSSSADHARPVPGHLVIRSETSAGAAARPATGIARGGLDGERSAAYRAPRPLAPGHLCVRARRLRVVRAPPGTCRRRVEGVEGGHAPVRIAGDGLHLEGRGVAPSCCACESAAPIGTSGLTRDACSRC